MDYLTWLLTDNDAAWTEPEEDEVPSLPVAVGKRLPGDPEEEAETGISPESGRRGSGRILRSPRREGGGDDRLPASVRQRAIRAETLRLRADRAALPSTESRRTGSDGNLFAAVSAMAPTPSQSSGEDVSMEEISRFFERDARRYG